MSTIATISIKIPPKPVDSQPVVDKDGKMTKPWRDYFNALEAALKVATVTI